MKNGTCDLFLEKLPKAELHIHIEGALEPEQFLLFAHRNHKQLPLFELLTDDKSAYRFSDFDSFIKTYLQITQALCTQQDFYELTLAYLYKANQQGVRHAEIFFDLQSYIMRNINPDVVVYGIHKGLLEGFRLYGITGSIILCFLRHLSEDEAFKTFSMIEKNYKKLILIIGLAALEKDNPVVKFARVFQKAKKDGYHCVAHIAELGGPELIWQALDNVPIDRIDHGIGAAEDVRLMQELVKRKIPLTICPLSNVMLKACKNLREHPIKIMYEAGILVTINSDDPAFFKSYIADNYRALRNNNVLSCPQLIQCARNSIYASFAQEHRKQEIIAELEVYIKDHSCTK
ncbi:MAG: adenosine deaminase [Candidatus Babeliales bacterium]|nr:adenosine deaminase [Candidatus Babeliales bacterium]